MKVKFSDERNDPDIQENESEFGRVYFMYGYIKNEAGEDFPGEGLYDRNSLHVGKLVTFPDTRTRDIPSLMAVCELK